MNTVYTVAKLPTDKVDQAFPLMQAMEPHVDLARWREMCAAMKGSGDGARDVLVTSGPRGHFRALCFVEIERSAGRAPAVAISKLFVDNALDPDRVARATLDALAAYCKAHGCSRLRIAIRGTDEATVVEIASASAVLQGTSVTVELT